MKSDALSLASEIRLREKTVSQVLEEHIKKIQSVNVDLRAVVETRYDQARNEAREKDEALSRMSSEEIQKLPPLFGVPFTSKEAIAVCGMRSTMGSIHHKDRTMSCNATVIDRIQNAGAILVGTTNLPEIGFWFECDNVVYGQTRNPYDLTRTCGGSSGGEGAIIGAGASPFGVGSDIGGSIRMPAAFCGIFGHKPSDRLIPMTGHYPVYVETATGMVGAKYPFTVIGPMARTAADLELLFRLMAGPDGHDQNIKKDFKPKALVKNAEDLKVFFLPAPRIHGTSETDQSLSRAVVNASRYLKEMGATVEEMDSKVFLRAFELWTARAWSIDAGDFTTLLSAGKSLNYHKEFLNLMLGKRQYTFPSLLMGFLDRLNSGRDNLEENLQELAKLKHWLSTKLEKNGVLIMPTHPRLPPKLHSTYTRPFDFAFTAIINALGFPATAVPMGLTEDGLPLSLQVVAAEDQDHLCLSVAQMLELGFGGYTGPTRQI